MLDCNRNITRHLQFLLRVSYPIKAPCNLTFNMAVAESSFGQRSLEANGLNPVMSWMVQDYYPGHLLWLSRDGLRQSNSRRPKNKCPDEGHPQSFVNKDII